MPSMTPPLLRIAPPLHRLAPPPPRAMSLRFSANLSWLFPHLPALPARLEAAAAAGFGAVEAAWPAGCPAQALRAAAERAGVRIVLLNTPPGTAASPGLRGRGAPLG